MGLQERVERIQEKLKLVRNWDVFPFDHSLGEFGLAALSTAESLAIPQFKQDKHLVPGYTGVVNNFELSRWETATDYHVIDKADYAFIENGVVRFTQNTKTVGDTCQLREVHVSLRDDAYNVTGVYVSEDSGSPLWEGSRSAIFAGRDNAFDVQITHRRYFESSRDSLLRVEISSKVDDQRTDCIVSVPEVPGDGTALALMGDDPDLTSLDHPLFVSLDSHPIMKGSLVYHQRNIPNEFNKRREGSRDLTFKEALQYMNLRSE